MRTSVLEAFRKRANYITQAKDAGWLDRPGLIGDGINFEVYATVPRAQVLDYYMVKIIGRVNNWGSYHPSMLYVGPSRYGWSEEDDYYWERRILFPWLFAKVPTPSAAPESDTNGEEESSATTLDDTGAGSSLSEEAAAGVIKQAGVLQDDILYNLSLLCVNVLQPLKDKYPNMIVVSGLRQFNTGMSQHERGEAADIQFAGQTSAFLYEVATYIEKSLQFDQLILHYTASPELSWIHVSFSAQELRRSVLTRDYDDTYSDGLYVIEPLTGESRAAAEREKLTDMTAVDTELRILGAREAALETIVIDKDAVIVDSTSVIDATDPSVIDVPGGGGTGDGSSSENPYGVV